MVLEEEFHGFLKLVLSLFLVLSQIEICDEFLKSWKKKKMFIL